MSILTGYIGTYASKESLGIYRFTVHLENGVLSDPVLYYEAPDCKYLSLEGNLLAAPEKKAGRSGICLLDTAAARLGGKAVLMGETFEENTPACYVTQDNARLYTANYHEGTVLVYEKRPEGPRLVKRIFIGPNAGCHQVLLHGGFLLAPCLLLDSVKIFENGGDYAFVSELTFEKGTGPRHGVFDRAHRRLFLVSELSSQIYVYQVSGDDDGNGGPGHSRPHFNLLHIYPILPKGAVYEEPPASAAIRLSPDEQFLYTSTRFAEVITVFAIDGCRLEQVQQTDCAGVHPRDFVLTPDGNYLIVANRTRGGLVCFRIEPGSGKLLGICSRAPAPEAVSVVLECV